MGSTVQENNSYFNEQIPALKFNNIARFRSLLLLVHAEPWELCLPNNSDLTTLAGVTAFRTT